MADREFKGGQDPVQGQKSGQGQGQRAGAITPQGRGSMQRGGWGAWSPLGLGPQELWSGSPFDLMRRMTEEMDRMFGATPSRGSETNALGRTFSPDVEVFERDDKLVVRADLPGLGKDDVRIELTDDGLLLQGERRSEHKEEREGFLRTERSYGRFQRFIPLPPDIDADQAEANFDNGVLEVTLPMTETRSRRRQIPVNTTAGTNTAPGKTGTKA